VAQVALAHEMAIALRRRILGTTDQASAENPANRSIVSRD
jgi:hypothetical protein